MTYTFRTKFGLAIIRCVRQVESQAAATARLTSSSRNRSKARLAADLANFKLTSSSFGIGLLTYLLTFLQVVNLSHCVWFIFLIVDVAMHRRIARTFHVLEGA